MNKKAALNQVFVFLLSIIIVVFIGFLVTQFISTFTADTEQSQNARFYNEFEQVYTSVYTQWGSEKPFSFALSGNTEFVCFIQTDCSVQGDLSESQFSDLRATTQSNDNVVLLTSNGIESSQRIGEEPFRVQGGCSCYKVSDKRLEVVIRNDRNEVIIEQP